MSLTRVGALTRPRGVVNSTSSPSATPAASASAAESSTHGSGAAAFSSGARAAFGVVRPVLGLLDAGAGEEVLAVGLAVVRVREELAVRVQARRTLGRVGGARPLHSARSAQHLVGDPAVVARAPT